MALDSEQLSKDFFDAFSKNAELTGPAKAELEDKCKLLAAAIETFVKTVDVTVDIPVLQVATSAGAGTTAPGQGFSSAIN